jgi:hypothetical protein
VSRISAPQPTVSAPRSGIGTKVLSMRGDRTGVLWRDRGSVTAEAAVALPALVLVLAASLWAVAIVGAHLQCVDAARAGARAAARGESADAVRVAVARSAPAGAEIGVFVGDELTRVDVSVLVQPEWGRMLPPIRVRASAVAATEPGVLP